MSSVRKQVQYRKPWHILELGTMLQSSPSQFPSSSNTDSMNAQMTSLRTSFTAPTNRVTGPLHAPVLLSRRSFAGVQIASPTAKTLRSPSRGCGNVQARQSGNRALEGAKKAAEGGSYGQQDGGGNGTIYLVNAVVSAAAGGLFILAPEVASRIIFAAEGAAYEGIIARILGLGFLTAATMNWTQEAAAKSGFLGEKVHRRMDGALSFFAAANLFITAISFIPNPSLYPTPPVVVPGAAALGAEAVLQWWASGRNYAKYSPEGANPVAIIKSYLSDLTSLGEVNGLTSIIYALLTASFVGAGFGYIFAPTQTLDLAFGTAMPKTVQDVFLWQLAGAGIATLVAPVAITQKEAALENDFSRPDKRTLMAGLASASLGHLLILTPLLKTVNQGPASVPLLGTWALSALASTFIAISPETTEKDGL